MKFFALKFSLFFVAILVNANTHAQEISQAQEINQATSNEQYFRTDKAKQARQDWILNCQGCHKIDGSGRPEKGLPDLTGEVSKFLTVEGGREYLSRVPGITNASVNDAQLTELINWLLLRFDPDNIPADHVPYTTEEVAQWRKYPLSIDAAKTRENLLAKILNKHLQK